MASTGQSFSMLGDSPLKLDQLDPLLGCKLSVEISVQALERVEASRELVRRALESGATLYGINTGFGRLKNVRISEDELEKLQQNLILSHAVGVGAPAPDAIVRWIMLFKLQSLLRGHSGVRRETVELLAGMINSDCLPVIPCKGSLGASGDLAPLAHMVLPMIGEGEVRLDGESLPAGDGFRKAGLVPLKLQAKEGLALVNGTQYMSAIAAAAVIRGRRLAKHADIISSMSIEACRGSKQPFDERLHKLRPHAGAVSVAANMRALLAESEIMRSHEGCDKVQDPYSLRCVAAVHGASRDAIEHAAGVVETEINSVTDNPILFDDGDVISGGNFHGQSLAIVMDYMAIALAELASISERRTYLLLDGQDGLPPMLVEDAGINNGLMMLQYTAAALVNENKVLCTPASVDTITTSSGQEDHVSMGATSANKLQIVLDNVETVLAIEALCAAQGLDFRAPLKPGVGARLAHQLIRKTIPHVENDRAYRLDVQHALDLLRSQCLIQRVEQNMAELC